MAVAKKTVKKVVVKEKGLKAPIIGVDGKSSGFISLPEKLFGQKINNHLIAQAVRVYLANQRVGQAATKTRGLVERSTRKIYKQKGTGRARHGSIRAPIFVGGGVVFGPKPRNYSLHFPHKMKLAALASALSKQFTAGNIVVMSGLSSMEPKTKLMSQALTRSGKQKNALLVVAKNAGSTTRSARNIEGIDIVLASDMHTYGVMSHEKVIFMKEAIGELRS